MPRHWAQAVVSEALHCRKCGYDLRGLSGGGRCPECGLDIWSTVLATIDPAASRLPSLRNPPVVGNSMLGLTLFMLAGTLLLVIPPLVRLIDPAQAVGFVPSLTWPIALVIGVMAGWALWRLAPPRGSEPHGAVWIDIWRIAIGLSGWLASSCGWLTLMDMRGVAGFRLRLVVHLAAAVFATIGLIGLRGVLGIIGVRSREYRRSRGSRQSVELIIIAIGAGWFAALAHYCTWLTWFPGQWRNDARMLATIVLWMSMFMVVVGLSYVVLNAWWIRRALRRPPPPTDQLLIPPLPPDTWIPDRED